LFEESSSFLKKEPKNFWTKLALSGEAAAKSGESFLLLFFKKEVLPYAACADTR
jgi:hypothetical protein